jgi:uncharacterized membrane protein YgcG
MTPAIDFEHGQTPRPLSGSRHLRPVLTLAFTMCLVVTGGVVAQAAGSRPPLPPNGRELSPGQVPRPCAVGETGTQGYYFSDRAQQWVAAPFCYGRWGNLDASGSQIVAAGASVTVTAIPTQGSNSGTYAPQTGSITWQYPGKIVSGCGPKNMSCTVIPATAATAEWQWLEFHVSMPRTFFIDSPGDLCGGQQLCAGASTNAWSYVGIAPAGAASATTPTGGGNGLSAALLLYVLAALGVVVAFMVARSGTAGRPAKQSMAGAGGGPGGGSGPGGGGSSGKSRPLQDTLGIPSGTKLPPNERQMLRGIEDKLQGMSPALQDSVANFGDLLNLSPGQLTAALDHIGATQTPDPVSQATLQMKIDSNERLTRAQRLEIMGKLMDQIFKIQQDVTTNKSLTQDKAFQKYDDYIKE